MINHHQIINHWRSLVPPSSISRLCSEILWQQKARLLQRPKGWTTIGRSVSWMPKKTMIASPSHSKNAKDIWRKPQKKLSPGSHRSPFKILIWFLKISIFVEFHSTMSALKFFRRQVDGSPSQLARHVLAFDEAEDVVPGVVRVLKIEVVGYPQIHWFWTSPDKSPWHLWEKPKIHWFWKKKHRP